MKSLTNKVAAITGAGSGIGQAIALNLADQGCHIALSDINTEGMNATKRMLAGKNVKITCHEVDVSKKNQVYKFADDVASEHGRINIIVNNAGVGYFDSIEKGSLEKFEWLLNINLWGVIYGSKAFLPHLLESGDGHIVNVSSAGAFTTVPSFGAYCISKHAVKAFTETLFQELRNTCIGVTCVHPGGVKTNMAKNSPYIEEGLKNRIEKGMLTSPNVVAKKVTKAIRKRKLRLIVGVDAYLLYFMNKIFPRLTSNIMGLVGRRVFKIT